MKCRDYGCWARATVLMPVPTWLDLHPMPLCHFHARCVGSGITFHPLPKDAQ